MIPRSGAFSLFFAVAFGLLVRMAVAQTPATRPAAEMSLSVITEEGKKLIQAVVVANGKPVENATVSFGVKRTFGTLILGEDKTLDDGSAAVLFPQDLPGGPNGQLQIIAMIKSPLALATVHKEAVFDGARPVVVNTNPLPRALWAPRAPYALIIPIALLLAGVWATYAFVIAQVLAIRRGAKS